MVTFQRMAGAAALLVLLWAAPAMAAPKIVEKGWLLKRNISFSSAHSARLNPKDKLLYVGTRTTYGGVYRLDASNKATKLATIYTMGGITIAPSGDLFASEHVHGRIIKVPYKGSGRTYWASGFHSGTDNPVGMSIAPPGYTGSLLKPGEALVADSGSKGVDEVWMWDPAKANNIKVVHKDNGTLYDAVDVAIGKNEVYVLDTRGTKAAGIIFKMGAGGALTALTLSKPIMKPMGMTLDPTNGDLLVTDRATSKVLRVKPSSGVVSDVFSGLAIDTDGYASIQITADGSDMVVTGTWRVYVYSRCLVSPPGGTGDCDSNGIPDAPIPDAAIPDAPIPDTPIPDTAIPDTPIPDTPILDHPIPDTPIPDTPIPDTPIPGTLIPDALIPDQALLDGANLDAPGPDASGLDMVATDVPQADVSGHDAKGADLAPTDGVDIQISGERPPDQASAAVDNGPGQNPGGGVGGCDCRVGDDAEPPALLWLTLLASVLFRRRSVRREAVAVRKRIS